MSYRLSSIAWLLILLGLAGPAMAAQAQPAGKLIMSLGSVSVLRDGKESPAPRNTEVMAGDTLRTAASSNAQLRLNDGAIIALRPNSEFKVNSFSYNGKPDGSGASLSLLKGGVRAVTGAIGRTNRDNFKVDAVVATIGIRGTGFNIVLCDAACRQRDPSAKDGLYAGVFEGRIVLSNQSGSAAELGVNQFAYVADAKSAPARMLTPPSFLRDSLDAQSQAKRKNLQTNGVTEDGAENVTEKSPNEKSNGAVSVSSEKVDNVNLAPPSTAAAAPGKFFDLGGLGDSQPLPATKPAGTYWSFQSAEFNPSGEQRRADNQVLEKVNDTATLAFAQHDGNKLQTVTKNGTAAYAIRGAYTATQKEGGSDGGVISWGRWAGGSALVGNYGTVNYSETQGFHWIAGARLYEVPTEIRNQSFTFNLVGATRPTEAVANAQAAWRVYGGNLTANFGTTNVGVSGLMNLYLSQGNSAGNYEMRFNGTSTSNNIAFTRVDSVVQRVDGNTSVCVANCSGAGVVGFYGSQASHAGLTYEFNTGGSYVQGAAAFRR